jgi:tetratricopeptide (TPR) repeat protein
MMNEYDLALKYLNQALDIHKKENNQIGIAMAYGEIASIYYSKAEYEKAADLLLKSIAILKVEKSPKQLIAIKQKLANT